MTKNDQSFQNRSAASKKSWADNKAEITAKRNAHPNYSSDTRAENIRQAALARWADPEFRAKTSAIFAELAKTNPSKRAISVTVDGTFYASIRAARLATGLSRAKLMSLREEQ